MSVKESLSKIFTEQEVSALTKAIERKGTRTLTNFYSNLKLSEEDIQKVRPLICSLKRSEEPGTKKAEAMLKLTMLICEKTLGGVAFNVDISGLTPEQALKKTMSELTNPGNPFEYKFDLEGKGYVALFDKENKDLQRLCLSEITTCFSPGGAYRYVSEAYLESDNIFFVPILTAEERKIIGRFTVGIGYTDHYLKINNQGLQPRPAFELIPSTERRSIARLSTTHSNQVGLPEKAIDSTIMEYAANHGMKFVEECTFTFKLPKGLNHLYDDRLQNTGQTITIGNAQYESYKLSHTARCNIIGLQIEKGADVNQKNETGETPLTFVTKEGDAEAAKTLLEMGADPNLPNADGETALIISVREDTANITKLLLEKGADVNARNNDGRTALMAAIYNKNQDAVKLLLDKGADVNARDNDGRTALMHATMCEDTTTVRRLLDKGADVNARDNDGRTALMLAARYNKNQDAVKLLLDKGADVNARDNGGQTALMLAVCRRNINMIKFMVNNGADLNAQDENGRTTLMFAVMGELESQTMFLLEAGADPNLRDVENRTAYDLTTSGPIGRRIRRLLRDYGYVEHNALLRVLHKIGDRIFRNI